MRPRHRPRRWLVRALPAVLVALPAGLACAAPHILGGREHPATGVGTPLQQRVAFGEAHAAAWGTPTTLRLLFLRVDFPADTEATTTGTGEWSDCLELCGGDPDHWITKNAQDLTAYYQEVSGGRLTLDVTISTGVYRLPQPMASYGASGDTGQITAFISDSIQAADAATDFTAYDAILVVHAGAGEETDIAWDSAGDLWSLYYPGLSIAADGITITEAIIMPQTGTQDRDDNNDLIVIDPLGVYAHEFGHWLGLPDLYSTAWYQSWKGIGRWGLMGDGLYNRLDAAAPPGSAPAHPEAWSKLDLGWVQAETVATDPDPQALFSLAAVQNSERVLKVPAGPTTTRYFLLENRRRSGYDQGLPGEGLLVWLVDPTVIAAQRAYNMVNTSLYLPGVKLIEADGDNSLLVPYSEGDMGSAGDPYPGSSGATHLTPYTTPSSTTFGQAGWLYLQNVAATATQIEFNLGFAPGVPSGLSLAQQGCGVLQLSWNASSAPDFDHYRVYRNNTLWRETSAQSIVDRRAPQSAAYRVSAVDLNGLESAQSASANSHSSACSAALPGGVSTGIDTGSGHCVLAALAYNTPQAAELRHLRAVRDRYLRRSSLGRTLVRAYYAVSPALIAVLHRRPWLQQALRPLLQPLLALARWLTAR